MSTYKEKLTYNFLRKSIESLDKSLEWIDKIESEKGTLLISHGKELAEIYKTIIKAKIELAVLLQNILNTIN